MKLLIVDDEKIIRETIAAIIDWEKMGIHSVIQASNGIEAYNTILDENPDIVMTDIKMPGLSGLDLIRRIYEVNQDTRFIIITGYGEFEYAKTAMQFGVRNYLLKPCNEDQIIQSILSVKKEIEHDAAFSTLRSENNRLMNSYYNTLVATIISNGISVDSTDNEAALNEYISEKINTFKKYIDLDNTAFEMLQFFFLPECDMNGLIQKMEQIRKETSPDITFHYLYVKETMTVFFRSYQSTYEHLDQMIRSCAVTMNGAESVEYRHQTFPSFRKFLEFIMPRIKRFETIFYTNENETLRIDNHNNIQNKINSMMLCLFRENEDESNAMIEKITALMKEIDNVEFLKHLARSIIYTSSSSSTVFSIADADEQARKINACPDRLIIIDTIRSYLSKLCSEYYQNRTENISTRICRYVNDNIADTSLSLKWISENYLYMNVDYISRKFLKETGEKFSNYLTEIRIRKTKEYLLSDKDMTVQQIAELVGCGNNPQYLSQIFKKQTGMTFSQYKKEYGT